MWCALEYLVSSWWQCFGSLGGVAGGMVTLGGL